MLFRLHFFFVDDKVESSNKQKIYIYTLRKDKKNTFINPPFVKEKEREREHSKNEIINILTHYMCTESARIRTKGSLRVIIEKKNEDAHRC